MGSIAWSGKDVLSILDFSRADLETLFEPADDFLERPGSVPKSLADRIVATAFFEPSTRTRLSFSTAALKLGGKVIDLSPDVSSVLKGESLSDTIRMLESYSDLIVMRHPSEGAALLASEVSEVPIVNGGDGSQHHPSQAMLDLYTVRRLKGRVDGLRYAVLGDTRYARTAASFLYGLAKYKPASVYLVSPEGLRMRDEVKNTIRKLGLRTEELDDARDDPGEGRRHLHEPHPEGAIPGPQRVREGEGELQDNQGSLLRAPGTLSSSIRCPRINELAYDVDDLPNAAYMEQARLGVPVRMALLHLVMGGGER